MYYSKFIIIQLYLRYQQKLSTQLTDETTFPFTIICRHLISPAPRQPLFSNFSTQPANHNSMWNNIPVSPIEPDEPKHQIDSPIGNSSFLPLKKSDNLFSQQPLELPSIVTGSSHTESHYEPYHQQSLSDLFKRDLNVHVANVGLIRVCKVD